MSSQIFGDGFPKPGEESMIEAAPESWMNAVLLAPFLIPERIAVREGRWSQSAIALFFVNFSSSFFKDQGEIPKTTSALLLSSSIRSTESKSPIKMFTEGWRDRISCFCSSFRTMPVIWYSGCLRIMLWRS